MNKKITNILLVLSIGIFLFGSGYRLGEYKSLSSAITGTDYSVLNAKNPSSLKNLDFSLFWETWNKLEEKYVDKKKLDPQKMLYGAIKGMTASLDDPYTFFMTPTENQQSKNDLDGKFEGIGAQLGLKDNVIVIIAPLKNSPAEVAGIQTGDIVSKVDDQSVKGWTLMQAVSKIRGTKGTKVKLTVMRGAKEISFNIIRDVINVASVELNFNKVNDKSSQATVEDQIPSNIAYLKLNIFGSNTNDEWDKAIDTIAQKWNNKEVKGMILDLRDNPGGFLESAVYLASDFLPKGNLVVKQESASSSIENQEYDVVRTGRLLDIPLVVLVNKGSASASEILSGALRDHKRAKLIGEKTFGKGSVQEAVSLSNSSGLHVTVAKWILPNGDWIMGKGINPDIAVENKVPEGNTITNTTDAQLQRAILEVESSK